MFLNALRVFCPVLLILISAKDISADAIALVAFAHENRIDGCVECGCRSQTVVQAGERQNWWMTFGLAKASEAGTWTRSGPQALSYCGWGTFKSIEKIFSSTKGIPYIIVEIEVTAAVVDPSRQELAIRGSTAKLAGFKRRGGPKYDIRKFKSAIHPSESSHSITAALIAEGKEREEFQVHEVVVSLEASVLVAERSAGYGTLAVESDVPGAEILLDGGLVGRVSEGRPFLIENIPAREWTVEVRDFSGRVDSRTAVVRAGKSTPVRMDLLSEMDHPSNDEFIELTVNPQGYEERWRRRDGAIVVRIPAGEFLMGSEEPRSDEDERPEHVVYLDDYWIDKTEVTWRQFAKFAAETGRALPPEPIWGRLDHYPLSSTNWEDADRYCDWVGGRLPTEAEWEKAARGTDGREFPWGDEWDPTRCNSISGGMHRPEAVGSFPGCLSPYGVLDMAGSHWQWVSDFYAADYYDHSPPKNPRGPESGSQKVKRGGYWMGHPVHIRTARRGKSAPDWRNTTHGFRCVHVDEREEM